MWDEECRTWGINAIFGMQELRCRVQDVAPGCKKWDAWYRMEVSKCRAQGADGDLGCRLQVVDVGCGMQIRGQA